jgi:maltooligosyltrehalose trehalohydrolase
MPPRSGAQLLEGNAVQFSIWAPVPRRLELVLPGGRFIELARDGEGYATTRVEGLGAGTRYQYRLDGSDLRPDPAAALLPDGVHGPAEVVDLAFPFTAKDFRARPLRDWTIYELHVGTFSKEGTFAGVERALPYLKELGINTIELMPVAPFPGARNWGYDGINLYGVQASYGGPRGLQQLVDAAHRHGIGVVLDVVYNHLGPEGNYASQFMPFFTHAHHTPWGDGINYDGAQSAGVRRFVLDAALRWFETFLLDGLRLDAVHGIVDGSQEHVLQQLSRELESYRSGSGRGAVLIAESDLGESRVVRERPAGWGMDAQWSDDFHHALHARLTGEKASYYVDHGRSAQVATAMARGYVYEGEASTFRGKPWGDSTAGVPPERFVVCAQNHDQIGNRARGERLSHLVPMEKVRLAAVATLLAPHVPMLFQGEEYGARGPFQYFTSHTDPALARAVSEGRAREFPELKDVSDIPDPQALETFARSTLDLLERQQEGHAELFALHHALLALRAQHPSLGCVTPTVTCEGEVVRIERATDRERSLVLLSFAATDVPLPRLPPGLTRLLDSADVRFGGPGAGATLRPFSAQVWLDAL